MTIGIVGSGAIGSLLAAQCVKQQQKVVRLVRSSASDVLHIQDITEQCQSMPIESRLISQKECIKGLKLLVLPLKAYQIEPALIQLKPELPTDVSVLLLHNGMLDTQSLCALLPANPLYSATTSYAAYKASGNKVVHTGLGQTFAGPRANNTVHTDEQIKHLLQKCLPPCHWQTHIERALWDKLAINAVINPLTARHKIKNGVLKSPQYAAQIQAICQETLSVMIALGYQQRLPDMLSHVYEVINKTSANYSSMHQDVVHQRPTEIDYINGYIVKQGQKLGIPTPVNKALLTL